MRSQPKSFWYTPQEGIQMLRQSDLSQGNRLVYSYRRGAWYPAAGRRLTEHGPVFIKPYALFLLAHETVCKTDKMNKTACYTHFDVNTQTVFVYYCRILPKTCPVVRDFTRGRILFNWR